MITTKRELTQEETQNYLKHPPCGPLRGPNGGILLSLVDFTCTTKANRGHMSRLPLPLLSWTTVLVSLTQTWIWITKLATLSWITFEHLSHTSIASENTIYTEWNAICQMCPKTQPLGNSATRTLYQPLYWYVRWEEQLLHGKYDTNKPKYVVWW